MNAVDRLNNFAKQHYGKTVLELAIRWILDRGHNTIALWGARHPGQLQSIDAIMNWKLEPTAMEEIDLILKNNIKVPIDSEFMAPPNR